MTILDNWMSTVDLPTYNFALYAVKAVVSDNPVMHLTNDQGALASGNAILIAKSGVTTSYLIDNVSMQSNLVSNNEMSGVQTTIIDFDLIEPLGFELADRLLRYSSQLNAISLPNMLFVLRLEFVGRATGSSSPVKYPGTFFYPFMINNITASVGPEGARYHITGNLNNRIAVERAKVNTDVNFSARTVGNFLSNLEVALNNHERNIRVVDPSQPADPQRVHRIVVDSSFSRLMPTLLRGVSPESDGTANTSNLEKSFTLGPNANIAAYITSTLTTESPAYTELFDELSIGGRHAMPLPYIRVSMDMRYEDERIDTNTNQRREIIVYTVRLFQSFERLPDNNPAAETSFRQDPIRQNSLLTNMTPFIKKRYDYLFSSLNTEIVNVDLTYDYFYFANLPPSRGEGYTNANQDFQPQTSSTANPFAAILNGFLGNSVLKPQIGTIAPVYDYQSLSATQQRVSETTGTTDAARMLQESDNQTLINGTFLQADIVIKGDPWWMGLPGTDDNRNINISNSHDVAGKDSLIIFCNWLPDESLAAPIGQHRGRLDIATSGVYNVIRISSRFQSGKFTQTLTIKKDTELTAQIVQNRLIGMR